MTDREKIADLIEDSLDFLDWDNAYDLADYLIDNGLTFAKDTNVPSWIPVTERLPEKANFVLVFTTDEVVGEALYYHDRQFYWANMDGAEPLHITHWMPLPEPPKEGHDSETFNFTVRYYNYTLHLGGKHHDYQQKEIQ